MREIAQNFEIGRGNAACETALSGVSAIPASGSYWDVSGATYVTIIGHLGTIHASDSPTFELKCADSASGTLDAISASALKYTPNVTSDDNKFMIWDVKVDTLPADHHFLAIALGGTLTNGSYADIFMLKRNFSAPISQSASLISSSAIMRWVS